MPKAAATAAAVTHAACPCGSAASFDTCCGPYLAGRASAPHAEALMRSRYTAYTLRDEAYLLATWHSSTRPAAMHLARDNSSREPATKWIGIGLEVKRAASTGAGSAIVEFVARFKTGGRAQRMHEVSRFVCEHGCWFYVNAEVPQP